MIQRALSFQASPWRKEGRVGQGHRSFRRADGLGYCCPKVYSMSSGSGVDNSSDSYLTDNNQHLLAQLIVQKEELLKRSILPGKLPPKATVVASLRKEIAELRQQLRESMERNVPTKSASILKNMDTNKSKNENGTSMALVNKSKLNNRALPSTTTDLSTTAREALLLMERSETSSIDERQLMLVASSAAWPDGDQLAELESLTQENALLKSRLAALLEHQRKLKVLKERLKEGGNNSPEKNENEQSTKKPPSRPRRARTTSSPATKTKRKSKVEKSEKIEAKEIETGLLEEVLV